MTIGFPRRSFLAAAVGMAGFAASGAEPTKVRFASVNGLSDAGVFLAADLGYFAEQGIVTDFNVIGSAPSLITALVTNQIDVAGVSITPGLFAATQRGIAVKIVGDKQSVRHGFSNTRMVVRTQAFTGDRSTSIAGLRGKSLAVSAEGSTAFYLMDKTLAKHGVAIEDVRVVEMEYPNIVVALTNGAVDGGMLIDPFLTKAIQSGVAKEVSDCADVAPGGDPSIVAIVYSENFLRNRDLAERWMLAYMRGVRVYNDAYVKHQGLERVIDVLVNHTHLARALIQDSFPIGLDPNQQVNLTALQDFQAFFAERGLLHQTSDVASIVDPSFAAHAISILGTYR